MTANGLNQPSARVSQAQGMVSVQAECTMKEALDKLKDRAAISGLPLEDLAIAVIDRRTRFN